MAEGTIVGKISMDDAEPTGKLVGKIEPEGTGKKTHDNYPARKNADGSYSTEVSITVTNPKLNDGKPTNIPSLWKGKEVDEDTAVKYALESGNKYSSFDSVDEAVKAAQERSKAGGAGAGKVVGKISNKPVGKIVGKLPSYEEPEDAPTAMEQLQKAPASFATRDLIAAADTVLGVVPFGAQVVEKTAGKIAREIAPMFGKSKESIDRETDKLVQQTQDVLGDPIKKAAIGLGMNKSVLEGSKVSGGMEALGHGKEAVDESIARNTGMSKRDASLLTDLAMVGVGELFGKGAAKVAEKTGLDKITEKFTDPSDKEMLKYEEGKAKRDREYQAYQERRRVEHEEKFQGPKEIVDPETGEIVSRRPKQEQMDLFGGVGTKSEDVVNVDSRGRPVELNKTKEEPAGKDPRQQEIPLEDTVRQQAIKDFQAKQDNPITKAITEEPIKDVKATEPGKVTEPTTLDKFLSDKSVQRTMELRRQDYFKEAGIEPVKGEQPNFKTWDEEFKDQIGFHLANLDKNTHLVADFANALKELTPRVKDREMIYDAVQRGEIDKLPEKYQAAAKLWENTMKQWGETFKDAGIIKGMLDDYASRIVDMRGVDPSLLDKAMQAFAEKQASLPTSSRFGKSRMIENYDLFLKTLEDNGLKLRTKDLAEVAQIYGDSMFKAMLNKKLIDNLKKFETPDGQKVFLDTKDKKNFIPPSFKRMTSGMYDGFAVHPDISTPMKFVLDAKEMGMVMRGLSVLSSATKRINVGASLFHATTLNVGRAFALSAKDNQWFNPVAQYKQLKNAVHEAKMTDSFDRWQDSNLKMGAEKDAGLGVFDQIARSTDDFLHKAGGLEGDYTQKTVKLASKPQELLDKITWSIIHDGSKLVTAEALLEKAMLDHPNVPEKFLRDQIATHVNDVYGGIDWFGAARDSNKFLEKLKMNMFNPEGRRYLQILEFAPDWTLSTLRVFGRAIPKNLLKPAQWDIAEGLAGIYKPMTAADHARRYQIRAMMYLMTVGNGLNIALSGHSMFDNKEFFSIELGDGRAIHPFKHYSEAFHWIGDFQKTFTNKLGFAPRMFLKTRDKTELETQKELLKSVLPFTITGGKEGIAPAVTGFFGVPMTGSGEGKIGGEGVLKNFERMKKRLERKLGLKINTEDEE